jgi:hypothetical protein
MIQFDNQSIIIITMQTIHSTGPDDDTTFIISLQFSYRQRVGDELGPSNVHSSRVIIISIFFN